MFKTTDYDKFEDNWLELGFEIKKFKFWYFFRSEWIYNIINYLEDLDWWFWPYWWENLHLMSHGEQFMKILESLISGKWFFIIDEIESAISSANQLKVKI